jgi:hypothetical protein
LTSISFTNHATKAFAPVPTPVCWQTVSHDN